MKKISVLGSTGSIGVNALKVISNLDMKIEYISAHSNINLLAEQAKKLDLKGVVISDESKYLELKELLPNTKILVGKEGLLEAVTDSNIDIVLNSIIGSAGLVPTYQAVKCGKLVALANKESLVMAGEIINKKAEETGSKIHPIDSEHSAIFQSLLGEDIKNLQKIYLTASGGPFRNREKSFDDITIEEALNHPNWSMGKKITIDSATMMNKGLELIEAVHLFNIDESKIEIIIHPESVIHSMVEFIDNSIIAQLGIPDMRIPIQFALTYPQREPLELPKIDFFKLKNLSFFEPDNLKFNSINLCRVAIRNGGTYPALLNAVNEIMVYKFLDGKIKFTDIAKNVEKELEKHNSIKNPTIEDVLALNDEIYRRLE